MIRQPVIGITWGARPFEKYLPYQRALEREGAAARKIDARAEHQENPLQSVDALLFPGGGDVNPRFYRDSEVDPTVNAEDQLDELELALARRAINQGMPVLGICRGQQLLNVALGGSLIQDLPAAGYDQVDHYAYHPIEVEPSVLEELMGANELQVNSRHHQAIRELAPGLEVTARSADGVIEAVEANRGRLMAVQCHPEDLIDDAWTRRLFQHFVQLAAHQRRSAPTASM